MITVVGCVIVAIVIIFYKYRTRNRNFWKKRGVATPSEYHWYYGHMSSVINKTTHLREFLRDCYNNFPKEPVIGFLFRDTPGLIVRDPKIIKAIEITNFPNFMDNDVSLTIPVTLEQEFLMSSNPYMVNGDKWKMCRGHITPALTYSKLKRYLPHMTNVAEEMVKYMENNCIKNEIELNIYDLAITFTSDVLGNAICGIETNSFVDKINLFHLLGKSLFHRQQATWKTKAIKLIPGLCGVSKPRYTSVRAEKICLTVARRIMNDRMNGTIRNDIFQLMMGLKNNDQCSVITDEYIAGQIFTIALDLCHTSSIVLINALIELAYHPEEQEKLRTQTLEFLSKDVDIDDIENFKYLHMVVSETLRLTSAVPTLVKRCVKKCQPAGSPLVIPKGTLIVIPIYSLHKDPQYYALPTMFNPEHFSDDAVAKRHKFTFLPYGEGPRKCLGSRISQLQIKVAVMWLVSRFRLLPSPRTQHPLAINPANHAISAPIKHPWLIFQKLT